MEALWIDLFAGSASSWSSRGCCLGPVLGVALALIVNSAASSGAIATSGREVAAAAATSPPSSRPPVARAAGSKDSAAGSAAGGNQRAEWTSRADRHDGKTDNNREGRLGKAEGRGNDKPKDKADGTGKGKGKFYDGQPLSTYRIADGATVRPPVDP